MRMGLGGILFLLGSTAWAQEIPPPLSAADFPPALAGKDLPRAERLLLAKNDPGPEKAKPSAAVTVPAGWTDADSRAAASALGKECLAGAWVARFRKGRGVAPRVKILPVRNRSTTFLNPALLARELTSGLGRLAAKGGPANVVLLGWLLTQNDASDGRELQSYLLSLSAVDLESGEKLWTGLHRVRKLVARGIVAGRPEVKVTPLKPGQAVDLSGNFNDADADGLSAALLRDLLASQLLKAASPRVLRFHPLRNRTSEMVNTLYLTALVEHGLVRSGKARVLCSREDQVDLHAERAAQLLSSPQPPRVGAELAGTHVVSGVLTALTSATGKEELRQYTITMEAFDLTSSRKDWIKTASIKKVIALRANP